MLNCNLAVLSVTTKRDTQFAKAVMKKDGNPGVRFWLLSIYGSRVMFQWQAVERGGTEHHPQSQLGSVRTETTNPEITFGPENNFQS
jgi:hypothetical protein